MRYYLCEEIIYTDQDVAELFKITADQVNKRYDFGAPIVVNGTILTLSSIKEEQLPGSLEVAAHLLMDRYIVLLEYQ